MIVNNIMVARINHSPFSSIMNLHHHPPLTTTITIIGGSPTAIAGKKADTEQEALPSAPAEPAPAGLQPAEKQSFYGPKGKKNETCRRLVLEANSDGCCWGWMLIWCIFGEELTDG